jgi:hypothetical protein
MALMELLTESGGGGFGCALSFAGHPKNQLPLLATRHLTSYKGGLLPHEARSGSEAGGHKRCRATRYSDNRDEEALLFEVHTTHLS